MDSSGHLKAFLFYFTLFACCSYAFSYGRGYETSYSVMGYSSRYHRVIQEIFDLGDINVKVYSIVYFAYNILVVLSGFLADSVSAYSQLVLSLAIFTRSKYVFKCEYHSDHVFLAALVVAGMTYLWRFGIPSFIGNSIIFYLCYLLFQTKLSNPFPFFKRISIRIGTFMGVQNSEFYMYASLYLINKFRSMILTFMMLFIKSIWGLSFYVMFAKGDLALLGMQGYEVPASPSNEVENLSNLRLIPATTLKMLSSFTAPTFAEYINIEQSFDKLVFGIASFGRSFLFPSSLRGPEKTSLPLLQSRALNECKCRVNGTRTCVRNETLASESGLVQLSDNEPNLTLDTISSATSIGSMGFWGGFAACLGAITLMLI